MMLTKYGAVPIAVVTWALVACGGGGDGDEGAVVPPGQFTQGIWRGTGTLDGQAFSIVVGIIAENGDANLLLGGDGQLRGDISSNSTDIDTSFSGLSLFGFSGDLFELFTFTGGTVSAGSSLTATLQSSDRTLSLDLRYDALYERPSSLPLIAGTWRDRVGTDFDHEWQIDAAGTLSGRDSLGCIFQGQVTVPNPARNLYRIRYQISGCYANAVQVDGLAVLDDTQAFGDTLHSGGTGVVGLLNTDSFVVTLTRQ